MMGLIQMKPLLPRMMLAPQSMLWKWFLQRFTSEGGTVTSVPCVSWGWESETEEREARKGRGPGKGR